jgi:cleavage and polyadenylation specificity factor subunit 1
VPHPFWPDQLKIASAGPDLRHIQKSSSLTLESIPLEGTTVICDMSTGVPRPFVPSRFRCAVFNSLHSMSYPDVRAMQRLISARYVWPRMNTDVRQWAKSCISCQKTKVQRHTVTTLSNFSTPDVRFDQIHIDLVGSTSTSFTGLYIYTHVYRQIHPLARSFPSQQHNSRLSGPCFHFGMDISV